MEKTEYKGKHIRGDAEVSVIVCIRNAGETAHAQIAAIMKSLERLQASYEVICVDDGSDDDTVARLRPLAEMSNRLKLLKMRFKAGPAAALSAGLANSTGEKILFYNAKVLVDPERHSW